MTWGAIGSAAVGAVATSALGGNDGGTQTQTKEMDPRLAAYYFGQDGTGGLLGDASKIYQAQAAQGGLNPTQRGGLEYQRQVLTSPQYTQGFDAMRQAGLGLLSAGAAANPFSTGQTSLGVQGGLLNAVQGARSGQPLTSLLGGSAPTGATMLGASNQQYTPFALDKNSTLSPLFSPISAAPPPPAPAPAPAPAAATGDPSLDDFMRQLWAAQYANGGGQG